MGGKRVFDIGQKSVKLFVRSRPTGTRAQHRLGRELLPFSLPGTGWTERDWAAGKGWEIFDKALQPSTQKGAVGCPPPGLPFSRTGMAQLLAKHRRATTFHSVKKRVRSFPGCRWPPAADLFCVFLRKVFRGAGWLAGLASRAQVGVMGVGAGVADRDEGQYRPRSHVFALWPPPRKLASTSGAYDQTEQVLLTEVAIESASFSAYIE